MENPDGAQSRIFIIVAIGLVGLLMLGIVSIALLVGYTRIVAPRLRPTVVAITTPTPTQVPGVTATATQPAAPVTTPIIGESPTATRVIEPGASPTPGEGSPTAIPAAEVSPTATPAGGAEIPETGFGPLEAVVGGIILVVLILLVRRLRLAGRT
jgi:hypothetical protein